jgi:hypothetical protein
VVRPGGHFIETRLIISLSSVNQNLINSVIIWRAGGDQMRISIIIMIIPILVIMLIASALTLPGRLISTGFRLP